MQAAARACVRKKSRTLCPGLSSACPAARHVRVRRLQAWPTPSPSPSPSPSLSPPSLGYVASPPATRGPARLFLQPPVAYTARATRLSGGPASQGAGPAGGVGGARARVLRLEGRGRPCPPPHLAAPLRVHGTAALPPVTGRAARGGWPPGGPARPSDPRKPAQHLPLPGGTAALCPSPAPPSVPPSSSVLFLAPAVRLRPHHPLTRTPLRSAAPLALLSPGGCGGR